MEAEKKVTKDAFLMRGADADEDVLVILDLKPESFRAVMEKVRDLMEEEYERVLRRGSNDPQLRVADMAKIWFKTEAYRKSVNQIIYNWDVGYFIMHQAIDDFIAVVQNWIEQEVKESSEPDRAKTRAVVNVLEFFADRNVYIDLRKIAEPVGNEKMLSLMDKFADTLFSMLGAEASEYSRLLKEARGILTEMGGSF